MSNDFSGMNNLKQQIAKEEYMGTVFADEAYENAKNPSSEAHRKKPRTILLQDGTENIWDFRNASHVDEVVNNLPDIDVNSEALWDPITGLKQSEIAKLSDGSISPKTHVAIIDHRGDLVLKDREVLKAEIADGDWGAIEGESVVNSAKELGYDGSTVVEEPLSRQDASSSKADKAVNTASYYAENARSPFASKDPAKQMSKDMLASAAPVAALGMGLGAMGYSDPSQAGTGFVQGAGTVLKVVRNNLAEAVAQGKGAAIHAASVQTPSQINNARLGQSEENQGKTIEQQQHEFFKNNRRVARRSTRGGAMKGNYGTTSLADRKLSDEKFRSPENLRSRYMNAEDKELYDKFTPEQREAFDLQISDWFREKQSPTVGERLENIGTDLGREISGANVWETLTPEEQARVRGADEFNILSGSSGAAFNPDGTYNESPYEDAESLGRAASEASLQAGLLTTWDDEGRRNIIEKHVPGATFSSVGSGENTVQFVHLPDGREFVINKPGFSQTDGTLLAAELAAYFPAAKYARGASFAGNAIKTGLGGALTDVGLQAASHASGANDEESFADAWDPVQTGIVSATGVAGEALGAAWRGGKKALGGISQRLFNPEKNVIPTRVE
jgi:hypothetical protein